jgi:hypothetical protein
MERPQSRHALRARQMSRERENYCPVLLVASTAILLDVPPFLLNCISCVSDPKTTYKTGILKYSHVLSVTLQELTKHSVAQR